MSTRDFPFNPVRNLVASRREFVRFASAIGALAATGATACADDARTSPSADMATSGQRILLRGGSVLSMDPDVGDFEQADVLIQDGKIAAIERNLIATGAVEIDARGKIVMPGFVDTHHHTFETALRSFLANGVLMNDGKPHGNLNYVDLVLNRLSPLYRPEDVYINELFGSLSQLDAGVTTVLDLSQIHHSPEHSDAAIQGLRDAGRRSVMGYCAGQGDRSRYPTDARRLRTQYFASGDQLLTMAMCVELYPGWEEAWAIGRELSLRIASHVVGRLGIAGTLEQLIGAKQIGPDNIFIHMTGMNQLAWQAVADTGASVSIAVPIEMTMGHGLPPVLECLARGIQPSLSTDVECTMTADFFTQMRSMLTLQRGLAFETPFSGPANTPELLTCRDVIRMATLEGAKALGLDSKVGTLTPGKQADIVVLNAAAINVAPLNNVPGAVVTLMDRSNVDTVIVGGKVRKQHGRMLDADVSKLRTDLEASRDYLFATAGIQRNLFGT